MADDSLNPDLVNRMREALGMAKKEMKELYAMASAYGKSLGISTSEINKSVANREKELRLVSLLQERIQRVGEESKRGMQLQNLSNQVSETANELASEQNSLMADLVLKQTMMQTGLIGSYAEQAKNYKILLDQGEITQDLYKGVIKRLQEEQHLNNELKDQLELTESIADAVLEIKEEAEAWKKSFTKITETAKAIARDPKVMGAFLLNEAVKGIEKGIEGFEDFKKQGLSAGQAMEAQMKTMSFASIAGLSDTKGVMNGIIEQYGNVNALSGDTVNELGKMAVHFGIAGEEAAKLNANLSQLPGETSETAANAMEHVGHMAELQSINPGKIMKDMAANSSTMALYSKGGAEAFGKSAIALHKMGVEIGTAAKMADGLLNFEDSINKQMEASVLLGREINLDKARELALSGDLAGSTAEVLKNIGGSAEFDKMNVIQKKALADATGMTVEELQKSIDAQEESNKYFGEGASVGMNALGYLAEYGSKAGSFFKENGMLLLTSLQFLQNQNLTKLKGYAMETAHWAKKRAQWLWEATMGKLLGRGSGGATDAASSAAASTPADAGRSTGSLTRSIQKINPGKLLAGAAALVLVAAAVFVFAKAAQEFTNVSWEDIGKAVVGMLALVGALALVGVIMTSGVGAIAILAGAAAMVIMAAALLVLGKAIQEIGKGFNILTPSLIQLAPMATDLLLLGAGMMALGVASLIAFPGLLLAASSLGLMILPLTALSAIASTGAINMLGEGLRVMSDAGPGLSQVALSMIGIAGGLGAMSIAGLAALPVIGALIALAAVAPALTGLGTALGGMFGGGGGGESDQMDTLIGKIDQLIAVASSGGEVRMDGKKVGEVIRLGLNSAGIR